MKRRITKTVVERLKPGQSVADDDPRGFVARKLPSGVVTYGFRYFDSRTGRQPWIGLGVHGDVTAEQARTKALHLAKEVRAKRRPMSARAEAAHMRAATVNAMLDAFVDRHVRPNLRSAAEVERCFNRYVRPRIGDKLLAELRRADVVHLLDRIEDAGAPVMADRVLAHLRRAFNWHATRDDTFTPPIVKGMARTKPAERARKRTLDDQEIRDLWEALDMLHGTTAIPKCFAGFVRFLLLSAQRRGMVAAMAWPEVDGGDWVIPEHKHKGKGHGDHVVPLTDALLALIGPKQKAGCVFTSNGGAIPFSGFSKAKAALDGKLTQIRKAAGWPAMKPWTYHDLRRTARSLMSRAGVPSDHAERVLAHVINGVRRIYDRHEYRAEKLDALEKLSALVERILHPAKTVVDFPKRQRKR
jgi:integrase